MYFVAILFFVFHKILQNSNGMFVPLIRICGWQTETKCATNYFWYYYLFIEKAENRKKVISKIWYVTIQSQIEIGTPLNFIYFFVVLIPNAKIAR